MMRHFGSADVAIVVAVVIVTAGAASTFVAASAGATGPPTPALATKAFGQWLHARYGGVQGYWTCPPGQRYGDRIDCLAEVRVGNIRHLTGATATLVGAHVRFFHVSDTAWIRKWSPYSRRFLSGPQSFEVPGQASENSPAFDWAFIAQGLRSRHHRSFHIDGYDGDANGWFRFFDFACSIHPNFVQCANAFGDAIRYRPPHS